MNSPEEFEIHKWLEKQGWTVKDWTGLTDTDILNWIEQNVEDIGTYATSEESYMVIKWSAVGPDDQVHSMSTRGNNLRDCVANAQRLVNTLETFD